MANFWYYNYYGLGNYWHVFRYDYDYEYELYDNNSDYNNSEDEEFHIDNGNTDSEIAATTNNDNTIGNGDQSIERLYFGSNEEEMTCIVCLQPWEINGPHKIISLKCGHLFGLSCIERWVSRNDSKCPTCKLPVHLDTDIINIAAKQIFEVNVPIELNKQLREIHQKEEILNSELATTKRELNEVNEYRKHLEFELNSLTNYIPIKNYQLTEGKNIWSCLNTENVICTVHAVRTNRLFIAKFNVNSKNESIGVYQLADPEINLSEPIWTLNITDLSTIGNMCLNFDETLLVVNNNNNSKVLLYQFNNDVDPICTTLKLPHSQHYIMERSYLQCTFDRYRPQIIYFIDLCGHLKVYDRTTQVFDNYLIVRESTFNHIIILCSLPVLDCLPLGGLLIYMEEQACIMAYNWEQKLVKYQLYTNLISTTVKSITYEWDLKRLLIINGDPRYPAIVLGRLVYEQDEFHLAHEWSSSPRSYEIDGYKNVNAVHPLQIGNIILLRWMYNYHSNSSRFLILQNENVNYKAFTLKHINQHMSMCTTLQGRQNDIYLGVMYRNCFYTYKLEEIDV